MFGAEGTGHIWVDISEKHHNYRIQYAISKYKIETMLRRFEQNPSMSGIVTMSLDLKLDKEDLARLNGEIKLSGENITLYNIDIDDFLSRFKRTQNFNLIDISAFMLAGPAGALVTKASDYAILFNLDPTKQTLINKFVSKWKVEAGRFMADDVALTTAKSRIAIKGGLDLYRNEFVGFTLAVVDEKGCPVISQAILGKLDKPQLQKVDAVGTILAPVTNVLKLFTTTNCEPFDTGSVPHPGAK